MGLASGIGLPSLWQLMPLSYRGAAALDSEVKTRSAAESSLPDRDKTEAFEQWQPFGRHVLLSDVVSISGRDAQEQS